MRITNARTTVVGWMERKGFPLPHRLGCNTLAWDEAEVDAWIDAQPRGFGIRPEKALAKRAEIHDERKRAAA